MDIFVSAEKTAELEAKLDAILQNQQLLFALMQDAGRLLMRNGKHVGSAGDTDSVIGNFADPAKMNKHMDDRLKYFLDQYGETCRQITAAKILSVQPRTISRMMDDGRLRRIGSKVDVRSIYNLLEGAAPQSEPTEKPVRKAKHTPAIKPIQRSPMDKNTRENNPVELHTGHSEFALASIGIRKENRATRKRTR